VEIIDLSLFPLNGLKTPLDDKQADTVRRAFTTLRETGFLAITGHGLSKEELRRHFDLGRLFIEDVSEEEKQKLHAKVWDGDWTGYKPQGYHKRSDGAADTIEHFGLYPQTAIESSLPEPAKPYLPLIRSFINHNHNVILRKLLMVLSLGLGLQPDTLWHLHHRAGTSSDDALNVDTNDDVHWVHSKDHLRYCMYHPHNREDSLKKDHTWMPGHTDLGSITFIYSQPVSGLQVLSESGKWQDIRYYPEHIVVNLGDSLEFVTGGLFKAIPHRVVEPPSDQRHLKRLGVFYFVPLLPDITLRPLEQLTASVAKMDSKFKVVDSFTEYYTRGGQPLTSLDWVTFRSSLVGKFKRNEKRVGQDYLVYMVIKRGLSRVRSA